VLLVVRSLLLAVIVVAACACREQAQRPAAVIDDMEQVLTALEVRCTETRATAPGLLDIAAKAVAVAKQRGRDLTTLQALRMLENSIHEGADMKIDCTDAANRLFSEI
jgi:hypothetical protein